MKKSKLSFSQIRKVLGFLWQFAAKPFRKIWYIIILSVLLLFAPLIEPYIYKLFINELFTGNQNLQYFFELLGFWLLCNLFFFLIQAFLHTQANLALTETECNYDRWRAKKLYSMDLSYFLNLKLGESIEKTKMVGYAIWGIFGILRNYFLEFLQSVVVIIFAFYLNWRMAILLILILPFFFFIYFFAFKKYEYKQDKIFDDWAKVRGSFSDKFRQLILIKIFAREKTEQIKFDRKMDGVERRDKKMSIFWGIVNSLDGFFMNLAHLFIFGGGIVLVRWNFATPGDLVMFLAFSNTIYYPLQKLGHELQRLQKNLSYVRQARKVFDFEPKIIDRENASELEVTNGKIDFKKIDFAYGKKKVLKNLSFEVEGGKMTALVGHSGAGKTTLINLLNRFYDLNGGKILIDGQNIAEVKLDSLRDKIGVVMQDNPVFNDAIMENIRYAKPNATQKEVEEAARQANLHEFVMSLSKKYKTVVGERGLKLSGGERQRLAIARVILRNPQIVILDEATSSLDSKNEKEIQSALSKLMQDRTAIVIAHRLSTVRR